MSQNEQFGIDVILNDANFKSGVNKMVADLQRVQRGAGDTGKAGEGMGVSMAKAFAAGAGAAALVTAIGAVKDAFGAVVKTGMEYTKQMSTVEAISNSSSVQMAELGSNARKLGADTKWSATNVAEAYEYMATAGWNSNQMLDASLPLLNLATAGALDLGKAADIVTDTMTPFGLAASEAGRVSDVFAVAGAAANLNVEQLGETMKYAAPIAATFGADLEDTTTIAMQFANGGIKASMAGTALRAGLSRLAAPPKAAANALEDLSVSTTKSDGTMKSLRDIIADMAPKFQALTDQQQIAAAKAIFGEEAYAGWILTLKGGVTEFDNFKNQLVGSEGAAQAMAQVMSNNLSGAMDNASSAAENLGLILFSRIEGGLTAATNGSIGWMSAMAKSIDPMNNLVEATKLLQVEDQKLAMSQAMIRDSYEKGKINIGEYNEKMRLSRELYDSNTTASGIYQQKMTDLDTQLASGAINQEQYNKKKEEAAAFSHNMAKTIDQEKAKQEELGQSISKMKEVWDVVWKFIKPIVDEMMNFIMDQYDKVKKFIDENGKEIEATWNLIWGVIKFFTESVWEGIKDVISGALDVIMGIIKVVGGIMNGDWSKVWEGLKQVAGGALDILWGIIQIGFGKLLKAPLKLGEDLLSWAGKAFSKLGSSIGKYIDDIVNAGARGWNKFVDDAKRIMATVKDWILHPIDNAKKALEKIDWGDVGKKLIKSLISGIKSMGSALGETVGDVASKLNPLNAFKAPDTPIGHIGGGQLMSPTSEFGLAAIPTGMLQSPSGFSGLSAVLDSVNNSISSLGAINSASSRGGKYSRTVSPSGSDSSGGGGNITVSVPLHIDGKEFAQATAEVNLREQSKYNSRKNAGQGYSKYF